MKQEDLIRLLNPMLRGWAQYHSPVGAKQAYVQLDHLTLSGCGGGRADGIQESRRRE